MGAPGLSSPEEVDFCYQVRVMEVEGVALWTDVGSGYLSAVNGPGAAGYALEEFALVPERYHCNLPGLFDPPLVPGRGFPEDTPTSSQIEARKV